MNKEELLRILNEFCDKNDFMLNPDPKHVDFVLDGLFKNEKKHGLKLCPCRLRDGSDERDLDLVCPCNFKSQDVWEKESRCWCGLFVRKK
jgi:ferredoxin-thioredoxin reductase catalytic chain